MARSYILAFKQVARGALQSGSSPCRSSGPVDNTVLFEKGTNLQELVLQSSKIAHHSYFQELLVWISKHQHLRRLRLNAIGLTDDDLSVLVSSEDGLTFLEELDLRSNQLTTVPAELGDPTRFGKLQKLLVSRNAELLKRDDELGRRARSDVDVFRRGRRHPSAAAVATRKLKANTNTADAAAVSNGGQFQSVQVDAAGAGLCVLAPD
eukprot:g71260.t1